MRFITLSKPSAGISGVTNPSFLGVDGQGGAAASGTSTAYLAVIPSAGKMLELVGELLVAPGVGKKREFQLTVNGTPVGEPVVIEGTNTTATWKGEVSVSPGDVVNIKHIPTGEPPSTQGDFIVLWETTGKIAYAFFASTTTISNSVPSFATIDAWISAVNNTVEGFNRVVCPINCTIKAIYGEVSSSPGAAKNYEIMVRKNQATDSFALKIEGSNVAANASGSFSVSAGDTLEIKAVPNGSPGARSIRVGIAYEPEIDGQRWAGGISTVGPSQSATQNSPLIGQTSSWTTGTGTRTPSYSGAVWRRLFVEHNVAPGPAKSRTDSINDAGAATALTVKIEGESKAGSDTTHTFEAAGKGSMNFSTVPAGTPAVDTGVHWGFVIEIPQPLIEKSGKAAVTGGGVPVALGFKGALGSALTTGGGSIVGIGFKGGLGVAAASGGGSIAGIGVKGGLGSALTTGGGLPVAFGSKGALSLAIVSGGGSLDGSGIKGGAGLALVTGGGSIIVVGSGEEIVLIGPDAELPTSLVIAPFASSASVATFSSNVKVTAMQTKAVTAPFVTRADTEDFDSSAEVEDFETGATIGS